MYDVRFDRWALQAAEQTVEDRRSSMSEVTQPKMLLIPSECIGGELGLKVIILSPSLGRGRCDKSCFGEKQVEGRVPWEVVKAETGA